MLHSAVFLAAIVSSLLVAPSARSQAPAAGEAPAPTPDDGEPGTWESVKDTSKKVGEAVTDAAVAAKERFEAVQETSKLRRGESSVYIAGNYSYFDLLIPGKKGATLGYVHDANASYELEYLEGEVSVPFIVEDLGYFKEQRLSLLRRNYLGKNAFNIFYGLSYVAVDLQVGSDLMTRWTDAQYPHLELMEVETLGATFGLGNRWTSKRGFVFGVDWFSWSQPLIVTRKETQIIESIEDGGDRKTANDTVKWLTFFPRISALKLHLGYMF